MITGEVEVTVKFQRQVEDDGEINEPGKDHLLAYVERVEGDDAISTALIKHIHTETGIDIRDYGVGEYVIVSKVDE